MAPRRSKVSLVAALIAAFFATAAVASASPQASRSDSGQAGTSAGAACVRNHTANGATHFFGVACDARAKRPTHKRSAHKARKARSTRHHRLLLSLDQPQARAHKSRNTRKHTSGSSTSGPSSSHPTTSGHPGSSTSGSGASTSGSSGSGSSGSTSGSAGSSGAGSGSGTPTPVGVPGSWSMIFDDEFTGSSLNTNDWSTGWFGSGITSAVNNQEVNCYDPNAVAVSSGALTISASPQSESCGGATQPYTTGLISSNGKFQFSYGTFEARVWMPGSGSTVSDWPVFWADGQTWPQDGEIDVAEGLGGQVCYHFHYTDGGPGGCAKVTGAAAGWHTYSADWEPGSITYYYDGVKVGQQTSGVTSDPMYLILSLGVSDQGPASAGSMKVDYVRVWQHPAA